MLSPTAFYITLYPDNGRHWIAAINTPLMGAGFGSSPFTEFGTCDMASAGAGFESPGSFSGNGSTYQLLGHATYSPAINVPGKYMSPTPGSLPGLEGYLQIEHYSLAIFPLNATSPATSVSFSYDFSYPYTDVTLGQGDLHWGGNVTVAVG